MMMDSRYSCALRSYTYGLYKLEEHIHKVSHKDGTFHSFLKPLPLTHFVLSYFPFLSFSLSFHLTASLPPYTQCTRPNPFLVCLTSLQFPRIRSETGPTLYIPPPLLPLPPRWTSLHPTLALPLPLSTWSPLPPPSLPWLDHCLPHQPEGADPCPLPSTHPDSSALPPDLPASSSPPGPLVSYPPPHVPLHYPPQLRPNGSSIIGLRIERSIA